MTTDLAGRTQSDAQSSVVRVICTATNLGGTGFLHRSGRVITAAHVVAGCSERQVVVLTWTRRTFAATVVADQKRDLALITPTDPINGRSFPISSYRTIPIGSAVISWGFPAGYTGRTPLLTLGYLAGHDSVKLDSAIAEQWVINAAFNGGNSGGPVLDVETGAVIGVVSGKLAPLPDEIESILKALKANDSGLNYTGVTAEGEKVTLSESQMLERVLEYLRSQTQLVVGYAVSLSDLRKFLAEQHLE
jgi:serine protease Do